MLMAICWKQIEAHNQMKQCWSWWLNFLLIAFDRDEVTRWRHEMETFFVLLAICAGNSPVIAQRPGTRSFDAFFNLRLNERLSKQSCGWWFETPLRPLWRHSNETLSFDPDDGDVAVNCYPVQAWWLSLCTLVTPYGDINLGQHWLR